MNNKFAIIGMGRFGQSIAKTLAKQGAEVLAIDKNEELIEQIKDDVAIAVTLDSTDSKALKAQNIAKMDAVVVAIGEDFESLLLTCAILQELNVNRIICRAQSHTQAMILEKIGLKEILSPENEVGKNIAQRLMNPDLITFLPLPDEYEIVEVRAPRGVVGKKIIDIKLREKYMINLITIKRTKEEVSNDHRVELNSHITGVPRADTTIYENDHLIMMGKKDDINRFVEVNR